MNTKLSSLQVARIAVTGIAFFIAVIGISWFNFRHNLELVHVQIGAVAAAVAIASVIYLLSLLPVFDTEQQGRPNYVSHLIGASVAFGVSSVCAIIFNTVISK